MSSMPFKSGDRSMPRLRRAHFLGNEKWVLPLALLVEIAIFSAIAQNFFTWENFIEVIRFSVELGLLAVALFAHLPGPIFNLAGGLSIAVATHESGQWLAQVVGMATLLGFVLPLTYGLNLALNIILPHRVAAEGERQGLDLYELGAGAYPEFVTHSEEFTQLR